MRKTAQSNGPLLAPGSPRRHRRGEKGVREALKAAVDPPSALPGPAARPWSSPCRAGGCRPAIALVVLAKGHPVATPLGRAVPVRSLADAMALERGRAIDRVGEGGLTPIRAVMTISRATSRIDIRCRRSPGLRQRQMPLLLGQPAARLRSMIATTLCSSALSSGVSDWQAKAAEWQP